MIEVRVLQIEPHPDQATNNPGSWAVQYEVSYDGTKRTFWRWHTVRASYRCGQHRDEVFKKKPSKETIVKHFWDDTFAELHGFSFDKDDP